MTYSNAVIKRLADLCKERDITTNKLATLSGITQSTVDNLMNGKAKNPKFKTLHKLAVGLDMTVSELLDFPEINETAFEDEQNYVKSIVTRKCLRHLNSPNSSFMRGELGLVFCVILFHNNLMNVIQKILKYYYEMIKYDVKPRPVVMENIEKVINCGDPSYGGAMYGCTHCENLKFVPLRCHSKIRG